MQITVSATPATMAWTAPLTDANWPGPVAHGLVVAHVGQAEGPVHVGDRRALRRRSPTRSGHMAIPSRSAGREAGVVEGRLAGLDGQRPFAAAGGPGDLRVADAGHHDLVAQRIRSPLHAGSKNARVVLAVE